MTTAQRESGGVPEPRRSPLWVLSLLLTAWLVVPLAPGCGEDGAAAGAGASGRDAEGLGPDGAGPLHSTTISGRVLDASSGQGVPNASVATSPASASILTNASGLFVIATDLAVGSSYRVSARKPGYSPGFSDITVLPGSNQLADILLVRGADDTECFPICRTDYTCRGGICVDDCNPPCPLGQVCRSGACVADCSPDCGGRACGLDPACRSVSCGDCNPNETCNDSGRCECPAESCAGACCAAGDVCYQMHCCAPVCAARECGSDGCGGICGVCSSNESCDTGVCFARPCQADCGARECGGDGCGGICGSCALRERCDEGICVPEPCIPSCRDVECGDDGCGGTCRPGCPSTHACSQAGRCILTGAYALLPSGSFTMGSPPGELGHSLSEGPQHEVVITRPFYMKTTEVTQKEWMSLMGNNPSHYPDCGLDCPVEVVSWWDAVTYGNAISRALGLPECYELSSCVGTPGQPGYSCLDVVFTGLDCPGYRLPTEAEWEYAYRAGRTTAFYNGGITAIECDPIDISLYDIGWYCSNSMDRTHPAGLKIANAWGLYDMAGNVGEWTWDRSWRDYSTETVTDPLGPDDGTYRVVRGGNYVDGAVFCRAASRYNGPPGGRSSGSGFRLVRSGP